MSEHSYDELELEGIDKDCEHRDSYHRGKFPTHWSEAHLLTTFCYKDMVRRILESELSCNNL